MDKPFKTYEQLEAIMRDRGLDPGAHARAILEREGYYPVVNGYRSLFIDEGERYRQGATLDEVYALFVMDRRLRSVLFRHIALAEGVLKSVCCYEFCSRHQDDNEAYLDPASYRTERRFRKMVVRFINDVNVMLGRDPKRPPAFAKDYLDHYKSEHDNIPLWVTMNSLSLGQAFKFYTFLDESTRFAISQRFQEMHREAHGTKARRITHESLRKSYDHIKDFRNICAHDERLFCAKVDKSKSTDFRRLMADMYAVLTADQCASLYRGIAECLDFAKDRIATIGESDILRQMGFNSRVEVRACLDGDV